VFLDRLQAHWPAMRYIHVMRNGLDMAYSANQNQPALWGRYFLGVPVATPTPRLSLAYWCCVHRRVAQLGARMPGRYLLINYDAFCADPQAGLGTLLRFLGREVSVADEAHLLEMVQMPASIGRHRLHDATAFDPADVAYARELGFTVELAGGG
jgi:hypothetical protein